MQRRLSPLHFVGVGGIGMAALAELFHAQGHAVSGSDLVASFVRKNRCKCSRSSEKAAAPPDRDDREWSKSWIEAKEVEARLDEELKGNSEPRVSQKSTMTEAEWNDKDRRALVSKKAYKCCDIYGTDS